MRQRLVGYASIAVAAVVWGSLPVVVRVANAPPAVLVALRLGIGALALGAFLAAFGRDDVGVTASRGLIAAMGVTLAVHWVLFFVSLELIAATAVLIGYVFPILVAVAAPVVLHEPREPHVLPLAFLGLAGLLVIVAPEMGEGRPAGALFALGAAVTASGLIIAARRVVQSVPGPVIAFWQYLIGAVALLPLAIASVDARGVPWRWGLALGVVYTAAMGVLFFRAIGRIPAQEVGILMYLEPAAAVLFTWWLLGEVPHVTQLAGGALVVASGVALVAMSARAARDVTAEPVVS